MMGRDDLSHNWIVVSILFASLCVGGFGCERVADWVQAKLEEEPPGAQGGSKVARIYGPRGAWWGMSQAEVMALEGDRVPTRETKNTLIYEDVTAGLDSVVYYAFEENKLIKTKLLFAHPKIPSLARMRSRKQLMADYDRLESLMVKKYGNCRRAVQRENNDSLFDRRLDDVEEKIRAYRRKGEDLLVNLSRKREEAEVEYSGWKNKDEIVARVLEPYESEKDDVDDWILALKREREDLQLKIRRERRKKDSDRSIYSLKSRWHKPAECDIGLYLVFGAKGPSLALEYDGLMTKSIKGIPSEL